MIEIKLLYSIKKKEGVKGFRKLKEVQSQVNNIHFKEKLGTQNHYQDSPKVFASVTKAIKDTIENVFKENQSTKKANEELNQSNEL